MLRKIFKTGNSVVVSLPKDAMEYLHIKEGMDVQIVITPADPPGEIAGVDQEFARQVAEFIEQYRLVLEELAN